jgi:hypothetical protein
VLTPGDLEGAERDGRDADQQQRPCRGDSMTEAADGDDKRDASRKNQ